MLAWLRKLSDLGAAQLALLRARRRLHRAPLGSLAERRVAQRRFDGTVPRRAFELAHALATAADRGVIRPKCLVRAMALHELLDAHGIAGSQVRVGVRRRDGKFAAHAWVTLGDTVLADDPAHVRSFTEVQDIRVLDIQ